ncbi:MAG: capsid cement protein [Candidatus Bathyarchaeia archaeon]
MTDLTGKTWMAIGETDDPNAIIESVEAAAAVTKGDPVYLSADHKVSPAATAQDCIGIAVKSAAQGEQCPVLVQGRVKVKAGGVITRGKAVYAGDASKRVLMLTDQAVNESGTASYTVYYNRRLGTALETTASADDLLFIQI